MRKANRLSMRTSDEVKEKLMTKAQESGRDSMSQEAHIILEKALGIKRAKKAAK
jgi:hypothetical protein